MNEDLAGPLVVCSVLEQDATRVLRAVEAAPEGCDLVEIRADHLRTSDLVDLVRRIERPLIVTLRRLEDGGAYEGSEQERRAALLAALEAGARWIDVEHEGPAADLVASVPADRVILSHHGAECDAAGLRRLYRRMAAAPAGRLKIVPHATEPGQAGAIRETLEAAAADRRELACFATGRPGALTRVLACSWGSWATYGSPRRGAETAAGQFTVSDLLDVYDVTRIGCKTRLYALLGTRVFSSPSPAMHHAGHVAAGLDARYVPIELDRIEDCLLLVGPGSVAGIEALAVTMPFKSRAAERSTPADEISRISHVVNTVLVRASGWRGYNTDGPAAVSLVRAHSNPKGRSVAIAGAGGTARALAAAFKQAGAHVTLFARDHPRGRAVASELGVDALPLARLVEMGWDILINATPLGADGERIVEAESLRGQLVLDVVYSPEPTPLVRDARERGVTAIEGYELLTAQAVLQFRLMTGVSSDAARMGAAGLQWLRDRSG